jgi:hypothetical protein
VSNCVLILNLDRDYKYEAFILGLPQKGEFSICVRVPFSSKANKILNSLTPLFNWPKDKKVTATLRQGCTLWALNGVILHSTGLGDCYPPYCSEACTTADFYFRYDKCACLAKPLLGTTRVY